MKYYLQIFLILFTFLVYNTSAQVKTNIAPNASVNCSTTSGNGCWNLNRINDKDTGSCGTQQAFVWSANPPASSDYIEWTWTTAQTFNEIWIMHAQTTGRFLSRFTLQYQRGSNWITIGTYSNPQSKCTNKHTFKPVTTSKLRLTNMVPGTGQTSNLNYREIYIFQSFAFSAGTLNIAEIDKCVLNAPIVATVGNTGSSKIDSMKVNWSINGGQTKTINLNKKAFPIAADTTITLEANYAFTANTNYNIKVWTSMPNGIRDTVNADDTMTMNHFVLGVPDAPLLQDTAVCGGQEVTITATPSAVTDSIIWSDMFNMSNLLATGERFTTPFLKSGKHKFYASATRNFKAGAASTPFTANNGQEGFFLDLESTTDVAIDSFATNIDAGAQETVELYIKDGTYVGSETNKSAWTLIGTQTVTPKGINQETVVNIPFKIKGGKTYGIAVRLTTGTQINYRTLTGAGDVITDGIFTYRRGKGMSNNFGGTFSPRGGDLKLYYALAECPSAPDSSEITINKLASGASIDSTSTFEGFLYAGSPKNPDVAAESKELNYELIPPTGFNNADHGSTWEVIDVRITSVNGTPVDTTSYSFTNPSATGNGNLKYVTDMGWADSTVEINWLIRELTHNCDTTVKRNLFIAPTTKFNFTSGDVCLGDFIQFKNKSSISSGYATYLWDFGDGNTSDIISPLYVYQNFGKYTVKLTSISDLGIEIDTTFTIEVFEIPDIDFKVFNACEGLPIQIQNNTTISSGTIQWKWKFGDGDSSAVQSPTHLYSKFGAYQVTLLAEANGCVSEETKTAFQFAKPTADFTSTGICANSPISFKSASTIGDSSFIGHRWNFENNEYSTLADDNYTFSTDGSKNVSLITTTKFGCKDSVTKTVVVAPSPKADFTVGQACDVDPTIISNISSENGLSVSYLWSFGNGNTSTDKDPAPYQYGTLGDKTIKLQVFGKNGCSSSKSVDISVASQPVANFEVGNACSGERINFINTTTNQGGKVTYVWEFGDGNSSSDLAAKHIYNVSNTRSYRVKLIASVNQGCTDTISKTIEIGETPDCGFTAVKDNSDRRIWTFTPNNSTYGSDAYQWQFGGTGYSQEVSPTHSFPFENNEYKVILFVTTDLGCKCMDTTQTVYTDWAIGVDELSKESSFTLYPNPAHELVTIQLSENQKLSKYNVSILDMQGKLIFIKEILFEERSAAVNIENLSSGNYLIKLDSESGSAIQKLTVK